MAVTFVPAPDPGRPGADGHQLRDHEGRPDQGRRARRCCTTPTTASRSSTWSTSRRTPRTCAAPTARACTARSPAAGCSPSCAIDNLWKGAAGQAVQDLNLMLGPAGDGGAGMTLLRLPLGRAARAREGAGAHRAARGLRERRASPPGIKPEGLDVGLLVSEREATVSAARFTTNALVAAPVVVSPRGRPGRAARGDGELRQRQRVRRRARAWRPRAPSSAPPPRRWTSTPAAVAIASTGVIARELPRDKLVAGHPPRRRGAGAQRRGVLGVASSPPTTAPSAPAWRWRCPRARACGWPPRPRAGA